MAVRLTRPLLRAQTDRRLVELAAGGSEPAFEALVERHRRELLSHCRRMLLPGGAAEDAVQNALMSAWRALHGGTTVREPRAWLHMICHREALAALRDTGYDHAELHDTLHGAGAPEDDLERRTAVRQALAGLAALPENQREALLRTAVEGRSQSDVARELGVGEDAVRGLVYRARATLRAGATALTPLPVLTWAAGAGAAALGGAGAAIGGGLLAKAGATLAVTGALAGGGVVAERSLDAEPAPPARTPAAVTLPDTAARPAPAAPARTAPSAPPARDEQGPRETSRPVTGSTDRRRPAAAEADDDRPRPRRRRARPPATPPVVAAAPTGDDDRETERPAAQKAPAAPRPEERERPVKREPRERPPRPEPARDDDRPTRPEPTPAPPPVPTQPPATDDDDPDAAPGGPQRPPKERPPKPDRGPAEPASPSPDDD